MNILKMVWDFISTAFTFAITAIRGVFQAIRISFFPVRMVGYSGSMLVGNVSDSSIAAVLALIVTLSIIVTLYRILRGNI